MPVIKNFKANLRAKYSRYIKLSIIFTLVLVIAAFKFSPPNKTSKRLPVDSTIWITVEDIESTIQKPKPPPPPLPEPLFATLEDEIEDIVLNDNDLHQDEHVDIPPPPPPPPIVDDEPQIFVWSEVMPEPIGGIAAIQEKVNYTEIGRKAGIEGTVFIEAIIDKDGNVIEAKVKKGLGGGLDNAALNAVKTTKFYPGKQRGKPVMVKMYIPIKFVLK